MNSISVVEPLNPAMRRVQEVLFQPFDLQKWLVLGFCAWLAQLGSGGGSGSGGQVGRVGAQGGGPDFGPINDWFRENMALVITVVVVLLLLAVAIGFLVTWLSSRGHFMFLDGVVHNRAHVTSPWSEYRREGNSLCLFRVCVGLATLLAVPLLLLVGVAIAWSDIQAGQFGAAAGLALIIGIPTLLLLIFVLVCISLFLNDFVVPIMYHHRLTVMPAWRVFRESLLDGRGGTFLLYVLFKFVIGIAIATLTIGVVCATCCIAALPYVGTVILLPLHVFVRSYSLYFLAQFGPEWQLIRVEPEITTAEMV